MSKSSKKLSKFLVCISGAIGLSVLGLHLYNKKIKKHNKLNSLEKHIIKNELKTLFKAEYEFIEILLNEDTDRLINDNIESVFELKSIKYALDVYQESTNFKTVEIKNLIKTWLLNNVRILEGYIGKIEEDEVHKSIDKLNKSSLKLKKIIKKACLYDSLSEDSEIQGYIIGTYIELNKGIENNNSVARYLNNLI